VQSSSQIITNKPTPSFVYRPDSLPVAKPTALKELKGKIYPKDLLTPNSPGGLPTLSLTISISWLPWGRFAMPLISPLMPVPHITLISDNQINSQMHCQYDLAEISKETASGRRQ